MSHNAEKHLCSYVSDDTEQHLHYSLSYNVGNIYVILYHTT